MSAPHWTDALANLDACENAIHWARAYDSLDAAWAACERGDWIVWLAARVSGGEPMSDARRPIVRASVACARLAEIHMPEAGLTCLRLCDRWIAGEPVTMDEMGNSADAADAAAACSVDAVAQNAAYAVADAAYAAVANAAYADDAVANAACGAVANAACSAGGAAGLRRCADICRELLPVPNLATPARDNS